VGEHLVDVADGGLAGLVEDAQGEVVVFGAGVAAVAAGGQEGVLGDDDEAAEVGLGAQQVEVEVGLEEGWLKPSASRVSSSV
jgi:hypothetical protein